MIGSWRPEPSDQAPLWMIMAMMMMAQYPVQQLVVASCVP
jgi:hypothetical protein